MSALDTLTGRLTLPYRRGAEFTRLQLGPPSAGATPITDYDFDEYRARWGESPRAPAYVVTPLVDIGIDDVSVTVNYSWHGTDKAELQIPAGTPAGTGFAIGLPAAADESLRLTSIVASPVPAAIDGQAWSVVALLGSISKLAWLLGSEKDAMLRAAIQVRSQRFVDRAVAAGLDAIGRDLRVPRFPPRPYGYDDAVVALWHLDDAASAGGKASDETTRGAILGHPGEVTGPVARAPGKYGFGFAFPGDASAAVAVASSPDFDIAAGGNATIEAFVSAVAPGDTVPRAIVARRPSETTAPSLEPGWSLCVVNARGFESNVQFAISDGTTEARCFADLSIADGGFHHVAAVIDGARQRIRVLVDGILRASEAVQGFGPVAPALDVRLGSTAAGNAFVGVLDEVRISRVARTSFHPALGESDDAYRARLRIFRSWVLPTPERVISLINRAAPLGNDPAPYILVDRNRPTSVARRTLRVVPAAVQPGTALAADGAPAHDESVAGTPDDDGDFDPALDLVTYGNSAVSLTPGAKRMQAATANRLDALASQLTDLAIDGKIIVVHAYDPAGPTPLHTVGRALRLRHESLPLDRLAAFAHRIDFAYSGHFGTDVAVAVRAGERLAIRGAPATGRVDLGTVLDLSLDPPMPLAGSFAWTIVSPGPARARLTAHPGDLPTLTTKVETRSRVRLTAEAAGDIVVRAEFTLRGVTRSGTLRLRIDPLTLAAGHAIDAAGNLDPDLAAIAGSPETDFIATDLFTHPADPRLDFGADPNSARMQVSARDALDALVGILVARGVSGALRVTRAFEPGGVGVEAVGRRLVLAHPTLDPGILGALAARSFDYVSRAGPEITAYVRAGPRIAIGDTATSAPIPDEIVLGTPLDLSAVPKTLAAGSYGWSLQGGGSLDTLTRSRTHLTPTRPGKLVLALTYVANDDTRAAPYTFEVALKPGLDTDATIVPKPQYDIIMNMLEAFRPIGVEVRTERLRKRVREVEQDPAKAFPAYSFPDFRL